MDTQSLVRFLRTRGFSVLSASFPPGVGATVDYESMVIRIDENQIVYMLDAVQKLVRLV